MNILVTGAASGIGKALCDRLVRDGHFVLAADIDKASLDVTASALRWSEPQVRIRQHDVRDAESWRRIVGEAISAWGRLDVLANVAGVLRPEFLHEIQAESVALQMAVNANGVILGTHAAAAAMIRQKQGHIINIASTAGLAPIPGLSVYSASKFAVRGFSLAAAAELEGHGIHITCVCPDSTDTPMIQDKLEVEAAAMIFSSTRPLTPEEVANVIATQVLVKRPLEIDIPARRGRLARLATLLPTFLTRRLVNRLTEKGRVAQRVALERRNRRLAGTGTAE